MATTHSIHVPRPTARTVEDAPSSTTVDRRLWLQVGIASIIGATAGLLGTWAIVATQTLQMHF
jgi:hypothetical protein